MFGEFLGIRGARYLLQLTSVVKRLPLTDSDHRVVTAKMDTIIFTSLSVVDICLYVLGDAIKLMRNV